MSLASSGSNALGWNRGKRSIRIVTAPRATTRTPNRIHVAASRGWSGSRVERELAAPRRAPGGGTEPWWPPAMAGSSRRFRRWRAAVERRSAGVRVTPGSCREGRAVTSREEGVSIGVTPGVGGISRASWPGCCAAAPRERSSAPQSARTARTEVGKARCTTASSFFSAVNPAPKRGEPSHHGRPANQHFACQRGAQRP